jgi:glycerol uptake facilitator-like aquaporin
MERRLLAEFVGALLLAGTVVGSGILATQLAQGNDALALLANTLATGAMLYALVEALGPVSGAHFNPAVTLVMALKRALPPVEALGYVLAQVAGCIGGVLLAHAMFALPLVQTGVTAREGLALSEATATFALVFVILAVSRTRPEATAGAVALVICAGYWWTPSTSFANPAITIARAMTETFAGIRLQDAPVFIAAQFAGALAALVCARLLFTKRWSGNPGAGQGAAE